MSGTSPTRGARTPTFLNGVPYRTPIFSVRQKKNASTFPERIGSTLELSYTIRHHSSRLIFRRTQKNVRRKKRGEKLVPDTLTF